MNETYSMRLHNVFVNDIQPSDARTESARDAAIALRDALR